MSKKIVMIRWCGMRLDGQHMVTSGMPFNGRVEVRGKGKAAVRVLVVSQREEVEMRKQRKWAEIELNFEVRDAEVQMDDSWWVVHAVEVGNE